MPIYEVRQSPNEGYLVPPAYIVVVEAEDRHELEEKLSLFGMVGLFVEDETRWSRPLMPAASGWSDWRVPEIEPRAAWVLRDGWVPPFLFVSKKIDPISVFTEEFAEVIRRKLSS